MNRSTIVVSIAVLAAGAAAISAAPVLAAESPPTRVVRFGDLNLSQPRDIQILYRRLEAAAGAVCGEPIRPGDLFVSADWRACVAGALQRAVAQLDRPALTAYHVAKIGTAPPLMRAAAVTQFNEGS